MSKQMIKVKECYKEVMKFKKEIDFTYEGKDYSVTLIYDENLGYDLDFNDPQPEWVEKWDNENAEPLAFLLDDLSEALIEQEKEKVSK